MPIPTFGRDRWDSPFGHLFPERNIFEASAPGSHQQLPATTSSNNGRLPPTSGSTSPPEPAAGLTSTQQAAATAITGSMSSSAYQLVSSPKQTESAAAGVWPQGDEAEALLDVYRKNLAHLFPFAVVPPHLSSAEMREQRPMFWKAIMMEACLFDALRQVALGKELLREISEAAFMNPQKNLDLLQGLQMLVAWLVFFVSPLVMFGLRRGDLMCVMVADGRQEPLQPQQFPDGQPPVSGPVNHHQPGLCRTKRPPEPGRIRLGAVGADACVCGHLLSGNHVSLPAPFSCPSGLTRTFRFAAPSQPTSGPTPS